jgi:Sec-independent protein translocase protein TatA
MDGIFGVGLGEILIVVLVIFVVGGPNNSAKWAREAGRTVRKLRKAWEEMMADMEKDLGPEGKEIMDVTRELSRSAYEFKNASSPTRLMKETTSMVEKSFADPARAKPASNGSSTASTTSSENKQDTDTKYQAWQPPDKPEKED